MGRCEKRRALSPSSSSSSSSSFSSSPARVRASKKRKVSEMDECDDGDKRIRYSSSTDVGSLAESVNVSQSFVLSGSSDSDFSDPETVNNSNIPVYTPQKFAASARLNSPHPQPIQESEDPEIVNDSNMSSGHGRVSSDSDHGRVSSDSDHECVSSDSDDDRELLNLPKRGKKELSCLASVSYGAENHARLPLDHENLCLFTCISLHLFRKKGYAFSIKNIARALCVLYNHKIPFVLADFERVLQKKPTRGQVMYILCQYVYGLIPKKNDRRRKEMLERVSILGSYKGHPLDDLVTFENYFKLRINLYTKGSHNVMYNYGEDEVNHDVPFTSTDTFVRKFLSSSRKTGLKVNLHITDDLSHVQLITDLDRFGDQFVCASCDQNFCSLNKLRRHETNCNLFQKYRYVGGVYNPKKTVFEKIEDYAIHVPKHLKFLEYFIVFDFESLLKTLENVDPDANGVYEKHVPVSVAVGSNVSEEASKGYFISDEDPLVLIRNFIEKLLELSDEIHEKVKPQFQPIFEELDKRIAACKAQNNVKECGLVKSLKKDLENLTRRAIVLTFNGSRYDVPLIFSWFFHIYREMGNFKCNKQGLYDSLRTDSFRNVLMRGTQVLSLVTGKLIIRDLSLFLAPGTSYKKYLKNYSDENDVQKLEKLHFPFRLMTSYKSLESTKLPTYQDFYSRLKDCNSFESEEQYENDFKKYWADPLDETKIRDGGTLLTILKEYNLNDCWPMIQAVIKHMRVYRTEMNVDLFYENVSLPGVAMKWIFTGEPNKFYTFPKEFGWVNRQIQASRTGGLCTVLKRLVKVGTPMRKYEESPDNPPKICRGGEVIDVTSLYPSTFLHYEHFINLPIFRQPPFFKPVKVNGEHGVSASSHSWLRYRQKKDKVQILSGHDNGEVKCGGNCYPVDGWSKPTKEDPLGRVYSYDDCWIHGHICEENNIYKQAAKFPPRLQAAKLRELDFMASLRRAHLTRIHKDLMDEGYTLVSVRSCEWAKEKRNRETKRLINERLSPNVDHALYPKSCLPPSGCTMEDIVMAVKSGAFQGIVKCDIFLEDKDAKKYEFFPFFCQNQIVTIEQLSPKMREICEKYELLKSGRKQLISTSNAKGFITVSQLLQWYLEHDAKINRIHWVLEYTSAPVFRDKIEQMAEFRRKADEDIKFKPQADASKLAANSFIGKCAENILTHTNTRVCSIKQVHQYVSKNTFISATPIPSVKEAEKANVSLNTREAYRDMLQEIDDFCSENGILLGDFSEDAQMYVVDTKKFMFTFKSPMLVQFTVYNLAKLHMLRFAHDVLLVYFEAGSVEIVYSDTDSYFLELSVKKLDLAVSEAKKIEFFSEVRHRWFPREFCEAHKADYVYRKTRYEDWEPMCDDCESTFLKDSKNPGLFKLESRFTKGVFLSPKLYCVENEETGEVKGGSKGIQRRDKNSTVTDFDSLETQLCVPDKDKPDKEIPLRLEAENTGFKRSKAGTIHTYNQTRSFSGIYTKRRLMTDQINTLPLLNKKDEENKFDTVQRAFVDDDNETTPEIFHRFYQNIIGQR